MKPSTSIRMRVERDQKSAQPIAFQRETNRKKSITLYYKMAKNIKNNNSKPFPCNRKPSTLVQRKIAVFRPRISRRMPSIRIIRYCSPPNGWVYSACLRSVDASIFFAADENVRPRTNALALCCRGEWVLAQKIGGRPPGRPYRRWNGYVAGAPQAFGLGVDHERDDYAPISACR
jgi:hypothetical protein